MNTRNDKFEKMLKVQQKIDTLFQTTQKFLIPTLRSEALRQAEYATMYYQNALSYSADLALRSLPLISEQTSAMAQEMCTQIPSIVQMTQCYVPNFEPLLNHMAESAMIAANTYMDGIISQWNDMFANISNNLNSLDFFDETISIDKDIANRVSEVIEQTAPEEIPEKNLVLSKIKGGKITIGQLVSFFLTVISLLFNVYCYYDAQSEQRLNERQNQAIIEELQKSNITNEDRKQTEEKILSVTQKLTDIVQEIISTYSESDEKVQISNQTNHSYNPKN
ncbi:MAG: hypothetical protein ACFWUC_07465 [Oscillospiraceae bacterium]|jgi:hypothetical protein